MNDTNSTLNRKARSRKAESYAEIFGSPGTRVRMAGLLRTQWPLLIVVALSGYLVRAALPVPPISSTIAGLLFFVLAVFVAAAANYSKVRLQAFLKGAKGEEVAARELSLLPQGYTVFHGLDIRKRPGLASAGSDLDHVVVGPTGIFAVETKNWSDSITIENGELLYDGITPTRPPLEQVKNEAQSLRAYLKSKTDLNLEIQPVLCFASNNLPQGEQGSSGVQVCNANRLTTVILSNVENHVTDSAQQSIVETLHKICET